MRHAASTAPDSSSASHVHATVRDDTWSPRLAIVATCTRLRLTGIPRPRISNRVRGVRRPATSTTTLPGITTTLKAAAHARTAVDRGPDPPVRGSAGASNANAPSSRASPDADRRGSSRATAALTTSPAPRRQPIARRRTQGERSPAMPREPASSRRRPWDRPERASPSPPRGIAASPRGTRAR